MLVLLLLPTPLWSFHNLEPSELEGCRLALRRCVEARCQDVECLSTLSALCLIVALSDCIIVSSYSDGELLLTRIHMSLSFLHLLLAQHPSNNNIYDPPKLDGVLLCCFEL